MGISEKGSLLPAPRTVAPRPRWKPSWAFFARAAALIIAIKLSCDGISMLAEEHETMTVSGQCPQVEPLFPSLTSPALSEMDTYITSIRFRDIAVARLAGAVQVPSPSFDDLGPVGEDKRWDVMYDLAAYLETTFPLLHDTLELEKVNTHGLLYTWQGSDESLSPTVLMAHQDVVPVAEATIGQWTHPPFSGFYDGQYVWGRGASDCKNILIGIMEAVELLIGAGFEPKRTLILSFGFDEESKGLEGAGHLAPVLVDRYGKDGAAILVDEGMGTSSVWGSHFALPGVAEKGYIDAEIIIRMPGGHSSIPPAHNAIGVMSELITMIEANPYEPHFHPENPYLSQLQCGAEHSPDFPSSLKKLLPSWKEEGSTTKDKLAQEAAKAGDDIKYLFTTSVAPDVISGGVKSNALPERVRVLVNHRVNVGDRPSGVEAKLKSLAEVVAEKYNLTVQAFNDEPETPRSIKLNVERDVLESAPVTPTSVDGVTPYAVLSGTSRAIYGEKLLIAPGMSTGNTDTRYYWDLTKHIFRYDPGWDPEDEGLGGIHTVDEKVSVLAHISGVQWYSMFIRNMDEADLARAKYVLTPKSRLFSKRALDSHFHFRFTYN
ncbi:Uu.00g086880.m01.CDS01 [Anthostomella pinea]|uniref:Uu.00g086880.m01.CDS01 n=1 Tax=Anthostomella pinea TaxID=933095 RepID=A0AAI8YJZ0_9PEZI|nr:Uu.00g086880.m01.CDS01 [Anthostomella pinea]